MPAFHVLTDTSGDISSCGATTTITLPTGVQANDLVIVAISDTQFSSNPNGPSTPSGWNLLGQNGSGANNGASGLQWVVLSIFWTWGSVNNLTFTNFSSGHPQGWICAAYRGVQIYGTGATPFETNFFSQGGTGNTLGTVGINMAFNASLELAIAAAYYPGTFSMSGFTTSQNAGVHTCCAIMTGATWPVGTTNSLNLSAPGTGSGTQIIQVRRSGVLQFPPTGLHMGMGW